MLWHVAICLVSCIHDWHCYPIDSDRLTWTQLMSVTSTVSSFFRRNMLANLKHRYVNTKKQTSAAACCKSYFRGRGVLSEIRQCSLNSFFFFGAFCAFLPQSVTFCCLTGGQRECLAVLSQCKYHCLPWQHHEVGFLPLLISLPHLLGWILSAWV